ncbi:hypothetical protein ASPZODRAFT_135615 [Penicilliopsis zonata CBS 506.65]|uniref:Methyltransferase domain-containing protein n=1 Tax=Penicilliopsis zonata CBS 506.65 TaxID=1073090 RepID=A0A1L9SAH3_9EURO|nr:hypothetical protein ASPZODRAFT_135615 [Penicilliopsis zonata CBS 506.65]OJJ44136.1 hypothetical protein ASPZODRAFT_135615 [Penicilliopsis zonata CBS 506.65]
MAQPAAANDIPAPQQMIEVDTFEDEGNDSTFSDGGSTYTTSLSSSVLAHEFKHGRRYHSYQSGAYLFPNDEQEQDRLDMTHHIYYRAMNDRLYLAPIKLDGKRVLDIGTGTGIWAMQMGDEHPEAEMIIGIDLSPIQPTWMPPNVKFIIDNVEEDWVEPQPYDYIHSRYMAKSIGDWPRLIRQAYDNLKPGGWVEFQEFENWFYSEDGTLKPDHYALVLIKHLNEACRKIGKPLDNTLNLEGQVKDQGFINVKAEKFPVPMGGWPKDKRLKEVGRFAAINWIEGVDGFTAAPFSEVLGWSRPEIEVLNAGVRRDCARLDVHAMAYIHVIIAQKPESA